MRKGSIFFQDSIQRSRKNKLLWKAKVRANLKEDTEPKHRNMKKEVI